MHLSFRFRNGLFIFVMHDFSWTCENEELPQKEDSESRIKKNLRMAHKEKRWGNKIRFQNKCQALGEY